MGNQASIPRPCLAHNKLSEGVQVVAASAADARQLCWLCPGERRWLPRELNGTDLICGGDFPGAWREAPMYLLLLGQSGAVLGLVGPRGLTSADGVVLNTTEDGSAPTFSLTLSRLNREVRSCFLVVASEKEASRVFQSEGAAGFAFITSAQTALVNGLRGGEGMSKELLRRAMCSCRVALPACKTNTALIMMALHAGRDATWHVEAIGKYYQFPATWNLKSALAALEPAITEIISNASEAAGSDGYQEVLPSSPVSSQVARHQPLRRSGSSASSQDHNEAQLEKWKAAALQNALAITQDSLEQLKEAVWRKQEELDLWLQMAQRHVQAGDTKSVMSMVRSHPGPLRLDLLALPLPQITFQDTPDDHAPASAHSTARPHSAHSQPPVVPPLPLGRHVRSSASTGSTSHHLDSDISCWTVSDVVAWLRKVHLGQFAPQFEREQVTGDVLVDLVWEDLFKMGITALSSRVELMRAIGQLRLQMPVATGGGGARPRRGSSVGEEVGDAPKRSKSQTRRMSAPQGSDGRPKTEARVLMQVNIDAAKPLGVLVDSALVAIQVTRGSQAHDQGVCVGWRVCSLGGEPLLTAQALEAKLQSLREQGAGQAPMTFLAPRDRRGASRSREPTARARGASGGADAGAFGASAAQLWEPPPLADDMDPDRVEDERPGARLLG